MLNGELSPNNKRDMVIALKDMLEGKTIINPSIGICGNLKYCRLPGVGFWLIVCTIDELAQSWAHCSHRPNWPVPHDQMFSLWEGKNLELRVSLMEHVIKKLEE